jgi:rubredoxin
METTILKRFDSPVEANIVKGLLESNDIFCFLQDEHSIGINPLYANALGGIKLIVRSEDEERAQEILQENEADYKTKWVCPQCGSKEVHFITEKKNQTNWFAIFLSMLLASPLYVKKKYECSSCKHVFESA